MKGLFRFTIAFAIAIFVCAEARSQTRILSYPEIIGLRASDFPFPSDTASNYAGCEFKFGYGTVGTTAIALWDLSSATPYSYIPTATILSISSGDVDDTSAAGDGARTLTLYGLDADYDEISESISLNGRNAATTTNAYLRIHRMVVNTAGASAANEGIIYCGTGELTDGVPATAYAGISVGENQTLMAIYTIPNNKIGLMYRFCISTDSGKTTTIRLVVRPNGGVFNVKNKYEIKAQARQTLVFSIPMAFNEKTDIEIRANVSAATGNVSATFVLVLVDTE